MTDERATLEADPDDQRLATEVKALFERGMSGEQVVGELMARGMDEAAIRTALGRALTLAKRERRSRDRFRGALWLGLGTLLAGLAHFTPRSTPLHYVLAWGVVAFGVYRIARSFK